MLLFLWMMAGFVTGALPVLLGRDWVYYTIYRVESFVDAHYAEQIRLLAAQHCPCTDVIELFQHCREEEIEHKDEALSAMTSAPGSALKIWGWLVGKGSQIAVFFAKRV
jgi:ubiquinone biosynthesis monooxygenase Coq7